MPGDDHTANAVDPDKMTPKELYDHFNKIDGLETSFANQLEMKFQEVLVRLPPAAPIAQQRQNPNIIGRARRVPLTDDPYEGDDDFMDEEAEEGEVVQQQAG